MQSFTSALKSKTILYYWAPAVLWAVVILGASNQEFSADNTSSWLQTVVRSVRGVPLADQTVEIANFVIRKLAHLTEYGIFSLLAFRGIRRDRSGSSGRWAGVAIALSAVLAAIDEYHQSFVPGRTGVVTDVLIDACGATIAQLLTRRL
jgi:VanZ family protein